MKIKKFFFVIWIICGLLFAASWYHFEISPVLYFIFSGSSFDTIDAVMEFLFNVGTLPISLFYLDGSLWVEYPFHEPSVVGLLLAVVAGAMGGVIPAAFWTAVCIVFKAIIRRLLKVDKADLKKLVSFLLVWLSVTGFIALLLVAEWAVCTRQFGLATMFVLMGAFAFWRLVYPYCGAVICMSDLGWNALRAPHNIFLKLMF